MTNAIDSKAPPAFQLPVALRSQGFALRAETDADIPFLQIVFASTRDDIAAVGWPDDMKRQFLLGQFAAQRSHYRTHYPDTAYDVLEHDGVPIGRLYVDARESRLHIIDIALMPEWRGRGIGSSILEAIIAAARAQDKAVSIFVERFNPALALYRRLGFTQIADTGIYLEMEWLADRSAADQLNDAQ